MGTLKLSSAPHMRVESKSTIPERYRKPKVENAVKLGHSLRLLPRKMRGHSGAELTNWAVGVVTGKTNHSKDNFTFENNETNLQTTPQIRHPQDEETEQTNEGSPVSWFASDSIPS